MQLRDSTVAFLCGFLGLVAFLMPMPVFSGPYEDIGPSDVAWTCSMPILSVAAADVDVDEVRDAITAARQASAADGSEYVPPSSPHPLCRGLARTQVVLGLLAFAGAIWRGRRWWRDTADARAEKRFKRLHASVESPQSRGRVLSR